MKKRNHLRLLLSAGLLIFVFPASGQSEATLEAERALKKADTELNNTYQQLQSLLKTKQARDELAKAQRAWIAFRNADSDFRAGISSGGGSAYSMDRMCNQTELTAERTRQLKTLLSRLP